MHFSYVSVIFVNGSTFNICMYMCVLMLMISLASDFVQRILSNVINCIIIMVIITFQCFFDPPSDIVICNESNYIHLQIYNNIQNWFLHTIVLL
jgi:hypothetical protein